MKYADTCATYNKFLNAGSAMAEEIEKHINKKGFLPLDLINELAATHAAHYQKKGFCVAEKNDDGAWKFKNADGKRHATAQMQWDRTIDPHHDRVRSNRGGARDVNRKDPVSELIAGFWDLTAKQRADFLARIK
jgi:hypothetical protein